LLVDGSRKTLFVPALNERIARNEFEGKIVAYKDFSKTLKEYLKGRRVDVDGASLNLRIAQKLGKFCKLKDNSIELLKKRSGKRPDEVAKIKKAVGITKQIFHSLDFKKAGTEVDIRKQLLVQTIELGAEPAFEPIVSTGQNTSYPHYCPGQKKLEGLVMVDYGVKYAHYCSDVTRCFILDGDRKKKEQYERLQEICHFLADSLPDLRTGKNVGKLGNDLLEKSGFGKMPHSIGHGVGLDIHEFPRLGFKSDDKIAGSVMAIEPAFYLKNYGMRFEETVDFTGKRAMIL
jgi:Xaa-Pro aminopeptidase